MADDDKQVDIEVVLRDTASQTLRSISREIDNISRKLTETGRKGSDALGRIREKGGEAGVGSGKAGEGVDKFTKSITGLTNALKGPLGLAAAFLAVGKSLSAFAQQRVELSLLTADIGLTTAKIGELKQLLSRKGVSEEATKQFITNIGGQLQDLRTRDVHSDFWRRMAIYDDPKLGAGLLKSVREGNIDQAFELLIAHVQELNALGEKGRSRSEYFTKHVLGQAPSQFTDWEEYRRQVIKTTSLTEAEAKKWRKEEADLQHKAEEIGRRAADFFITQTNRISDHVRERLSTPRGLDALFNPTIGTGAGTGAATPGPPGAGADPTPGPGTASPGTTDPGLRITVPPRGRGGGGGGGGQSSLPLNMQLASAPTPKVFADAFKDVGETEKETNQTLISIRDILTDMTGGNKNLVASLGDSPTSRSGQTTGDPTTGGPTTGGPTTGGGAPGGGLTDKSGKGVDPVTVGRLQEFAARGDTVGMRRLMTANGYRVDSAWCGDVTRVLVGGSGFPVPKGYPIASQWRTIGESIPGAGINEPGRSFGSLTATKTNVRIGSTGSHVMTVVPGTYDPKTNSAVIIDTGGRRRRSLSGFDVRWAGKEAEQRAAAARAGQPNAPIVVPGGPQGTPVPSYVTPNRDAVPGGTPQSARPAGGRTVRASWFNDRVTASGKPASVPGIALPSRSTLGQWFYVRDENTGKEILTQQTDVGPAKWTKRGIDINAPLAKEFGYPSMKSFPTDTNFSYRPALDRANSRGGGPQSSRRDGNVKASVDFGAMQRVKEAGEIFLPLRTASFSQGSSVHRNAVLPGSSDYTRWTA